MKSCEDMFDESFLFETVKTTAVDNIDDDALDSNEAPTLESHGVEDDAFEIDLPEKDRAIQDGGNRLRFSWRKWKLQLETNLSMEGVPFSRVPFDTSKIYPLKPEDEYQGWQGHVTALYDDDDTIATAPSIFSSRRSVDTQTIMSAPTLQEALLSDSSVGVYPSFDENSIMRHEQLPVNSPVSDTDFVKRVKNAAAIIIAPCVTPSLTNVLKSPNDFSRSMNARFPNGNKDIDSNVFTRTVCIFKARMHRNWYS
jgi:hypothetical protein